MKLRDIEGLLPKLKRTYRPIKTPFIDELGNKEICIDVAQVRNIIEKEFYSKKIDWFNNAIQAIAKADIIKVKP